jgi:enoyl-CoA hydratase/carnithine racemase
MSIAEKVRLTITGRVATLTIDNPPLNVLTVAVRQALLDRVAAIESHPEIAVVVLETALGSVFSVGSDVKEFPKHEAGGLDKIRFEQTLLDRIAALAPVTVAKARGLVLGGGAELMLACDLRVGTLESEIGFPEIRLGALPAAGGMKRLLREVGPARALDLVLRGRRVPASRALELGLLTAAVPADELDASVDALVEDLLTLPLSAVTAAKRAFLAMQEGDDANAIEAQAFATLFRTPDLQEGLSAFLEKRTPRFNQGGGRDTASPA